MHLVYSLSTFASSLSGLAISGTLSSASRATIDASRIVAIWAASFAMGWEVWDNVVTSMRILGFAFIILGVLIYNDAFRIIPYLKKQNIEKYGRWLCSKIVKTKAQSVSATEMQENFIP